MRNPNYGDTRQNILKALHFYFCDMQRKTIDYNDLYYFFEKKINKKVGKSRVREIVIDLETQGLLQTNGTSKIQRGRPHKQINLGVV